MEQNKQTNKTSLYSNPPTHKQIDTIHFLQARRLTGSGMHNLYKNIIRTNDGYVKKLQLKCTLR